MSDDLMEQARRTFEAITSPGRDPAWVQRRARVIRTRRVVVAGLAAVAIALGVIVPLAALFPLHSRPGHAPADTVTPIPSTPALDFQPADGWHAVTSDPAFADAIGWQAWAANVPFASGESPVKPDNYFPGGYPSETEKSLPSDGILLVADDLVQTRNVLPPRHDFPVTSLPLTITQKPSTQFEGQPSDRAMTVVTGTVNGRYVDVRVVFGTAAPSRDLIAEAQKELDRLVVVPAPATTSRLDQFGIRMALPQGWDGVLYRYQGLVPELLASTQPITDLYDGQSIWRSMGPSDVVMILAENDYAGIHYEQVTPPIAIGPADTCPTCEINDDGTGPPAGNSLYYRGFAINGREFDLYVEFGTTSVSSADLAFVNGFLRTLEVDPPTAPVPPFPSPSPFPSGPPAAVHAELPPGWIESGDPVPGATNPRIVAAFGTWPFPVGGDCGPENALAALPADGAFVWIAEYSDPGNRGDFYEPPANFHLDQQNPPARWTCGIGAPSRVELFRIAGRFFEIHIALGQTASQQTVSQVDSLISSLKADQLT